MTLVRLPSTLTPVTLHNAVASFPVPTASGGGDISGAGWRDASGFGFEDVNLHLTANIATNIPGPVAVYGEKDNGEIGFIGLLNEGQDIHIAGAAVGADFPVPGAGLFKKLMVGGYGATSTPNPAANVTVTALPIWMSGR